MDGPVPPVTGPEWADLWTQLRPGQPGFTYDPRTNGNLGKARRFLCGVRDCMLRSVCARSAGARRLADPRGPALHASAAPAVEQDHQALRPHPRPPAPLQGRLHRACRGQAGGRPGDGEREDIRPGVYVRRGAARVPPEDVPVRPLRAPAHAGEGSQLGDGEGEEVFFALAAVAGSSSAAADGGGRGHKIECAAASSAPLAVIYMKQSVFVVCRMTSPQPEAALDPPRRRPPPANTGRATTMSTITSKSRRRPQPQPARPGSRPSRR